MADDEQAITYAIVMVGEGKPGDEERPVVWFPRFYITGVPETQSGAATGSNPDAGLFFGAGSTPWGNHSLVPESRWDDTSRKWAIRETYEKGGVETVSYQTLEEWAKTPRRMTLRLPPGLHAHLVSIARSRGLSLNQIIVGALMDWRDDPYRVK